MSQDIHVTQLRPTLCSLCLGLRFAEPSRGATTWLRSQELAAGTVQKHIRNISGTYQVPRHHTGARSRNRLQTYQEHIRYHDTLQEPGAETDQKHIRNIAGAMTLYKSQEQEQIRNISGTYQGPQHCSEVRMRNINHL